jgi:hypothetical protein
MLVGLDEDSSTRGLWASPIYVLSWGAAGSVFALFIGGNPGWVRVALAGMVAVVVMIAGAALLTRFIIEDRPTEGLWGLMSTAVLLVFAGASWITVKRRNLD